MELPLPKLTTTSSRYTGEAPLAAPADLPSAPLGLVAAIVSTRFVTLSWQMPQLTGSSEITGYAVIIREEGSNRYSKWDYMYHLFYHSL